MNSSKLVTTCQICKSKNLNSILFLGYLPPVNKFIKVNTKPKQEESYPAELLFCNNCKLVQLSLVVNQKILFHKDLKLKPDIMPHQDLKKLLSNIQGY